MINGEHDEVLFAILEMNINIKKIVYKTAEDLL